MRKRNRQTEPSKRSSGGGFLTRQLPGKATSPRRIGFSAAMLVGAGLIVATSAVHSNLWSESYRAIPTIGNLFLAQVFAGVLLALGVIFYRRPLMAVAGIGYLATTIGGLLVSAEYGLFGFKDSLDAPFGQLTLNLEVAGIVAFAAAIAVTVNASLAASTTNNVLVGAVQPISADQTPVPVAVRNVSVPSFEEAAVPVAKEDSPQVPERLVWRPATVFATEGNHEVPEAFPAEPVPAEAIDEPAELPVPSISQPELEPVLAKSTVAVPLGGQFERSEQTVVERERVLGIDHPATLNSLVNLAYMYRSAGRISEALAVQERVAVDTQRIHGSKHPYTITSQANLAQLQGWMRKSKGKRHPVGV